LGFAIVFASCGIVACLWAVLPGASYNILVLGLDSRGAEGAVARTDSIMVVSVNTDTFSTALLSIPRDLFISVPQYGMERVNTINFLGEAEAAGRGLTLTKESIALAFNIPIERVVRLDFEGFVDLVDAVGGIDVYVEKNIVDPQFPTADGGVEEVRFNSGWTHMDGVTALKYARTRHTDDDYARAQRQQDVLQALATKLLNPSVWAGAYRVWTQSVATDMTLGDLLAITPSLLIGRGGMERLVIDRDYIAAGELGAEPAYDRLAPYLSEFFRLRE
jgi:LCP family protein required for cell wall assembly